MNQSTKQVVQTFVFMGSVMFFMATTGSLKASAYDHTDYQRDSGHSYHMKNDQSDPEVRSSNDNKRSDDNHSYLQQNDNENNRDKYRSTHDDQYTVNNSNHNREDDQNRSNSYRHDVSTATYEDSSDRSSRYEDRQHSSEDSHRNEWDRKAHESYSSSSSNDRNMHEANYQSDQNGRKYQHHNDDQNNHSSRYGHMANSYMNNQNEDTNCDDSQSSDVRGNSRHAHDNYDSRNYADNPVSKSNYHHSRDYGNVHYMNWKKGHNMDESNNELALTLRSNLQEHAAVVLPALRGQIEQSPDRKAALAAVDMNTDAVADTVDMLYADTKDEFTNLWQSHIDAYLMAATAARDNNETAMQDTRDKLNSFASDAADWFAAQNSEYDTNTLQEMFATHGEQTLNIIEKLASKDYEGVYTTAHEAYVHMGMLADYLAGIRSTEFDSPHSSSSDMDSPHEHIQHDTMIM